MAPVGKAAVAKPSPLAAKLGNPEAPELFDSLVPVAVHQALASYDVRKSELVNKEVDRLKEATNLANQLLSSMNLPAALEDTKGKVKYMLQRNSFCMANFRENTYSSLSHIILLYPMFR